MRDGAEAEWAAGRRFSHKKPGRNLYLERMAAKKSGSASEL